MFFIIYPITFTLPPKFKTPRIEIMTELFQPLLVSTPEATQPGCTAFSVQQFIELLKVEENYWPGEQTNTRLTITRLRKIFYDKWGWDDQLIRKAANIPGRYQVDIVEQPIEGAKKMRWHKNEEEHPKYRKVTYTVSDKVHPELAGTSPDIYLCNHQEVTLPGGYCCDIAHVLAGIDAYNNPDVVSPLPRLLNLYKIGPYVKSNQDVVTWLGDIASSSGDFLFAYRRKHRKPIGTHMEQGYIYTDAPGSDMLGNIDSFVISRYYDVGADNGKRLTEILTDYYSGTGANPPLRNQRCWLFCEAVGLKGWNGNNFENENEWIDLYHKELRDNICFQVASLADGILETIRLVVPVWFNCYTDVLKINELLVIWLDALKQEIKKEPTT